MNLFLHIVRRSFRSVIENLYLNAVACGVIAISILLLGVYLTTIVNLQNIVDTWSKDVHISAYFDGSISENQRFKVRDDLHKRNEVVQVRYVSELEAKQWMTEEVEGIEATMGLLGDNVLPASLEITLSPDYSGSDEIEAFAESLDKEVFGSIDYGLIWVEKFNAFLELVRLIGTMIGGLILVAAVFIVSNTTHLVIYNRREELEIAKYVGASDSYILVPFIFEGAIQGLLGSLCASAGLYLLFGVLINEVEKNLALPILSDFTFVSLNQVAILTAVGVALGVGSSLITTIRFLKKNP